MKKIKLTGLTLMLVASVFSFSGCANKNILMPGQEKSDCELNSGTHGVCGSPRSIYNKKDEIDGLGKGTDQAYFVHPDGTIQEISNGELGDVVEIKTLPNGRKVAIKKGSKGENIISPFDESRIANSYARNSFLFGAGEDTTMIRNQEVIREAWINTYTDPNGNLAVEHKIMIVTKKPSWAIGEETPKNVKKVKMIPSFISKDVIMQSHEKGDPKDDVKLKAYRDNVSETPKEDQKLKKYLKGL